MVRIGDRGHIPPDFGQPMGTSDTHYIEQMQVMAQMLLFVMNQLDPHSSYVQKIEQLIRTPVPVQEMANQINAISSDLDMKYGLDFTQLNFPNPDPPGMPGFQMMVWMKGFANFLEKETHNPAVEQWLNVFGEMFSKTQWSAKEMYHITTQFFDFTSQIGFHFELPLDNFYG